MPRIHRSLAASAAMIAALSLGTPQAFALDMPGTSNAPLEVFTGAGEVQENHRYRRYRRGPSTGEVIAGIAVIGAIAAIASSSSRDRDRRERVERYPARENVRYRDYREEQRTDSRGIDRAVDMCIEQVERGSDRVDSVDNATRGADGWRVSGAMSDGEAWNCWIDNDGRVRSIDFGSSYSASADRSSSRSSVRFESAAAAGEGRPQLSDADYARARAGQNAQADDQLREREEELRGGEAAYPGGPVDGEEYPGGEWVDDGRYNSAEASAVNARS